MKIGRTTGLWPARLYQQQQMKPVEQKRERTGDRLEISAEAKALLAGTSREGEVSRQEKLERIRKQLEQGIYQVDSRQVAERIFDFWFRQVR